MINPRFLLTFGVILMMGGIVLPFLMILKILQSTFFLIFLSSGISTLGLALSMIGFTLYTKTRKRD
jgi:hypothetical protein